MPERYTECGLPESFHGGRRDTWVTDGELDGGGVDPETGTGVPLEKRT